jgi:uncharacterized membrane protein
MSKKVIHTVLTAIVAVGISSIAVEAAAADQTASAKPTKMMKGMEKCYGIVKAGLNDCSSGANNNCAGSSNTDSDKAAWLFVPKGTCNKIVGSSTTPPKDTTKS